MRTLLLILTLFIFPVCYGQITNTQKRETIDGILKVLQARYIFPNVADSMQNFVISNVQSGEYDSITTGSEFAFRLTRDLQKISKDLHLKVEYNENNITEENNGSAETISQEIWLNQLLAENNHGIKSKKILEGNIGYLEIPLFGPLERCADTLISAMQYVAGTDALILDLRSCRGSLDENTIPFLCSYFFAVPTHLFDFQTRETNTPKQFWTYAWVPGKRYVEKPIYILTSGRTFSGGEELAYDLKQTNRAFVVGEVTRGGANPTEFTVINSNFSISVPYMRSVNPVTQTNWEGIGVQPDIQVKSNIALYTAHIMALNSLFEKSSDENQRFKLAETIKKAEANKPLFKQIRFELNGFENAKEVFVSGTFNSWSPTSTPMENIGNMWVATVETEPGNVGYKYIVDGQWITDPDNSDTIVENGYENSLLIVE
ncbi:S41 family peptidase [Mariniphaga sp.]|uniref:S41 family peptidase n=1 Tax=Mariniphaga sp. TaxID=1954475 RepID=UPI003563C398